MQENQQSTVREALRETERLLDPNEIFYNILKIIYVIFDKRIVKRIFNDKRAASRTKKEIKE